MERMMKVQEVLLRAMAKKITWWQAAEVIGVSARTMRRWRERLEEHGYNGLADRRKGVVSPKRVPLEMCEQVLGLYRSATDCGRSTSLASARTLAGCGVTIHETSGRAGVAALRPACGGRFDRQGRPITKPK